VGCIVHLRPDAKGHAGITPTQPSPIEGEALEPRHSMKTKPAYQTAASGSLTPQQGAVVRADAILHPEAWLLDSANSRMADLFTEDVLYFMPRRKNVPRGKRTAS